MFLVRYLNVACAALFLLIVLMVPAAAQPAVMLGAHPAHKLLMSMPIAAQIQTLISGPATPPATVPAATPAVAATDTDTNEAEPQETFGTRALNYLINESAQFKSQSDKFANNMGALPQLSDWIAQQRNDPKLHDRWAAAGHDLLYAVVSAFAIALLLDFSFIPIRNTLRQRKPTRFSRRLTTVLALVVIKIIPVLVFIAVSLFLLNQHETYKFPRFVVLNFVYALTLSRCATACIRGLFAPNSEALRLIPASTPQAVYGFRALNLFANFIVYGYFILDVAKTTRVPADVISLFSNIFALALILMTLMVIVQKRAFVATFLRGNLTSAQPDLTMIQSLRLWFARHWHILATGYLVIGYAITALGVENGFALMLRGTILTLLIFVGLHFLFRATERWGARDTSTGSAVHHAIIRMLLRFVLSLFALIAAAAAWGADIGAFFDTPLGQRILGAVFSIGITVIIVAVIYEFCNAAIERKMNRRDAEGKVLQASARVRTLLPMIRNTIFIVFTLIVGLVVLSEAGFNVAPLLAGAGIFGVALGFGSQTLVKDFLTGLFIVIENTIAIGDVVSIGTHSGTVEAMSMRTLRLRDNDGAMHILPFSEVTNIINMTKDFSYAVIDVGVAYHSDLEHVMRVLRAVGEEMQQDPVFKKVVLQPIEILGVDSLNDSSITIKSRIRTRPGKQWDVKRMMLLRIKQRFDKENIEIPFPTVMQLTKS